ncbi:hypothetical protein RND71_009731 [Anisodus tanguticus]|uniref:Uncharacterized protein n=1 Tax=Anisodus tanguticus TaxID=243964 RepID=A0AAE1VN68_9SOLA|nr:hypothetical protein RND71_009731 [Anisodus tanguticus]
MKTPFPSQLEKREFTHGLSEDSTLSILSLSAPLDPHLGLRFIGDSMAHLRYRCLASRKKSKVPIARPMQPLEISSSKVSEFTLEIEQVLSV